MAIIVLLSASVAPAPAEDSPAAWLREAESLIDRALTSDDLASRRSLAERAGAYYRRVETAGVRNPALHRASAHAAWLAGDRGRAVLELRRAHAIDPTDRRTIEGLTALRSEIGSASFGVGTPWWLRWRGIVARETLLWVTAGAWTVGWGAFAWWLIGGHGRWLARVATGGSTGVALLCAGLLALDRLDLADATSVVVVRESAGFSGPSDAVYESALDEPIPAGWEGRLVESRDGWARVDLSGLGEAWVPGTAIERIHTPG